MDAQRAATFLEVPQVIKEATADYNRIFGRNYDPFVETYEMEDAEIAFFVQGAHANTAKSAARNLRKQGVKAGVVRPRWIRPWPTLEIAEALSQVKAVGTVETSTSYGGAMRGGNLIHELRASLYDLAGATSRYVLHGWPGRRGHLAGGLLLHGKDPHPDGERQKDPSACLLDRF